MIRKHNAENQEKERKKYRKRERPYYTCTQLPLTATEMEAFPQGRPTSARVTDVPRTIPSRRVAPLVQGRALSHVSQLGTRPMEICQWPILTCTR